MYRSYIGRRLYLVFALTIMAAFAEGLGIALLLPLMKATEAADGQIDGTIQETLNSLLQWMGIGESVIGILVFIGVAFLAKGGIKFCEKGYRGYLQVRLQRTLKSKLFDDYNQMDYQYYISQSTGHFINVINSQVDRFYGTFDRFALFLSKTITAVSYFAIAFTIAWRFALVAVGVGLVVLFLFKYLNKYVRRLSRKASKEKSQLNKLLVQALQAFKYIVSTDQVRHLREGVRNSIWRVTGYRFRQKIAAAFTSSIREPVSVFFILIVVALQVAIFDAPVAPIFVALILFHRGLKTTMGVQQKWQRTMDGIGSLEMVVKEFENVKRYEEEGGSRKVDRLSQGIEFQNVSFSYGEEIALQDVSIRIPVDTTVALVGESGAGKSTLVDMLTLMLRPDDGEIYIDGIPGSNVELSSWRSQLGYVSQETEIFDDTVANNITLWKEEYESDPAVREKVENAAKRAYAHHFIKDLPQGYQTEVGEQGIRLSGGQRQRLFVARELYKNPNLLILDEATSDLDTASEQHIQDSIDALKGEVTVVIIAHRLSTVKNADRVYVLDKGRVIEAGTYHELRSRENGEFREMVEMQSL
ncbi:ABC transporter ATP-binding protein [Salinibacter sp.]|uniref:ABC transporter ATP-binding protein n=1 Tax=Salinibacter sp. TaxID=2065818 RepID=UPI0021E7EC25|nr:ABC transporter ATP-binding protein [Salinibacter sp.]